MFIISVISRALLVLFLLAVGFWFMTMSLDDQFDNTVKFGCVMISTGLFMAAIITVIDSVRKI